MKNSEFHVILDSGHGESTPGKRSPDGKFREYKWAREFNDRVRKALEDIGIKVHMTVTDNTDLALSRRASKANEVCSRYGLSKCLFVSTHCNAAGNGSIWMNATGWSCYTTVGKTNSDRAAEFMYKAAEKYLLPLGQKIRKDFSDGDSDIEANFTVIYKTRCPAILVENMFQDNREDVKFLCSDIGLEALCRIYVEGIQAYISSV